MLVEPKPDASSGEIFLSPRVIDSATYNEFAQRLRSLIDQADASAQSLRDTMAQASVVGTSLDHSAAAQKQRLQAAVKVIRAIDAVSAPAPTPITHDPSELQAALAESKKELGACADELIARVQRDSQDAVRMVDALTIKLAAAVSRAASSRGELDQSADQAQKTSTQLANQGRSLAALHVRANEALEQLEAAPARVRTAPDKPDGDGPDSCSDVKTAAGENDAISPGTGELASLCEQAQQLKDEIARSILDGGAQLDELNTRRRQLAGKVRDAILACQHAEASLLNTTQRVKVQALASSGRSPGASSAAADSPESSESSKS